MAGEYGNAAAALETLNMAGSPPSTFAILIASYVELGRLNEAQAIKKRMLAKHPNYTMSKWHYFRFLKRPEDRERFAAALRKAGLPE